MRKILATGLVLLSLQATASPPPFTGPDYSGRYQCSGHDSHGGDFQGIIEFKLEAAQSTGTHGAYTFSMTLADQSRYTGFAASAPKALALYFAHDDPKLQDHGVGIAEVETDQDGRHRLSKYYYTPHLAGGGHGLEQCQAL